MKSVGVVLIARRLIHIVTTHALPTHALISARIVITTLNYHIKLPQMLKHHGHISVCLLAL